MNTNSLVYKEQIRNVKIPFRDIIPVSWVRQICHAFRRHLEEYPVVKYSLLFVHVFYSALKYIFAILSCFLLPFA